MDNRSTLLAGMPTAATLMRPRVAISACLAGQAVRYDGTDKKLNTAATMLAEHLHTVTICPEVGAGMGVPRPPIQLVATDAAINARGRDNATLDMTDALNAYAEQSLATWGYDLCGYIVKSRSPSCGLNTTPIFDTRGRQTHLGSGLQADHFHRQMPWLQMSDEDHLATDAQCRDFIARCQILADLRTRARAGSLAALHSDYAAIIERLPADRWQRLDAALRADQSDRYWQIFGEGLQQLFQPG